MSVNKVRLTQSIYINVCHILNVKQLSTLEYKNKLKLAVKHKIHFKIVLFQHSGPFPSYVG